MADETDVLTVVRDFAGLILYPTPPATPTTPSPIAGVGVVGLEIGWPTQPSLDADIAAGRSVVSFWGDPKGRNTTRYPVDEDDGVADAATYTIALVGQVVTIGGAAPNPFSIHNIAVIAENQAFIVAPTAGETPAQVAAALQALIVVAIPGTTVVGAAITLPPTARIAAVRIGTTGSTQTPVLTEEKPIRVIIWAPSHEVRVAISRALKGPLAAAVRFLMPDGSYARVKWADQTTIDTEQLRGIYRLDLHLVAEFTTILALTRTQIVSTTEHVENQNGVLGTYVQ